jgi:hypothetical protein
MKTKRRKRTSSSAKRHPRRKRAARGRRIINPAVRDELIASCVRLASALIDHYFPGLLNVPAGSGDYMASSRKHSEVAELERLYRL